MKRIHIPNIYFIQGQAYQGKSSLARHFRQSLDCEVINTDQLFWRWCDKYHYKETRNVRVSLGRYFPYLTAELRREWFEYMVNYAIGIARYAKPDMVIEGWLLTLLPPELKDKLKAHMSLLTVTMQNYTAMAKSKTFRPDGSDYTNVVTALKQQMAAVKKVEVMSQVKYQRYEDCKHCAGRSASADRLCAFGIPANLEGKTILEIGCMTGYNSIRLAQRGATVYAIDPDIKNVQLSSRIANSIYRMPKIRFYVGDILTESFNRTPKFDYIIATNVDYAAMEPTKLFSRAHELLADDGQFLVEAMIPKLSSGHAQRDSAAYYQDISVRGVLTRCPNDRTVQAWAQGFTLTRRQRSSPPANGNLIRVAYTFNKGVCSGLVSGNINRYGDMVTGPTEPMGLDAPTPDSDFVGMVSCGSRNVGNTTNDSNNCCPVAQELCCVDKSVEWTHKDYSLESKTISVERKLIGACDA